MSNSLLRQQRKRINLSQVALARLADVSRWRLIMFEQGHLVLSADEMNRLAAALRRESETAVKRLTAVVHETANIAQ